MARKRYGKYTPDEFRKNLELLEAVFGSQKEAARRIGVDESTYRAYKTGKREPSKDTAARINRVYGRNKRYTSNPDVQDRIRKRKEKAEKLRQAREKQKGKPVFMAARDWIMRHIDAAFVRHQLLAIVPEYAAYTQGNPYRVQFLSGLDYVAAQSGKAVLGKPAGTKSVSVYGLYANQYIVEVMERQGVGREEVPEDMTDFIPNVGRDRFPMLDGYTQDWDLGRTLDYLEGKFFGTVKQHGRRKFTPVRFIGYQM